MTERDTHFQHAAHFLLQEMIKRGFISEWVPSSLDTALQHDEMQTLIAQFVYDVVAHAAKHINKNAIYSAARGYDTFMLPIVPDLTEWPEQT